MQPCILCPASHALRPSCHAQEAHVSRYCVLIAIGREDYRRLIAERSGIRYAASESVGPSWGGLVQPLIYPEPVAAPVHTPTVVDLALERRIIHCPWRTTPETGCGCQGLFRCAVGKGERPGLVRFDECMACVKAGGPPERPLVVLDRETI